MSRCDHPILIAEVAVYYTLAGLFVCRSGMFIVFEIKAWKRSKNRNWLGDLSNTNGESETRYSQNLDIH